MKKIIHRAEERGHANHGWLDAHHSFSFAGWYDPEKIHFGMLRVLNDDRIAAGGGFGMHPHNDMEIITIVLTGALEHKDNMGNGSVIRPGDVQVMSAGSGVLHSEFNPSDKDETTLFQLWIFPKEKNISPRYAEKSFDPAKQLNTIQTVASGFREQDELYIHQHAAISLSQLEAGKQINYRTRLPGNGVYVLIIEGEVEIEGDTLNKRDAAGISGTENFSVRAKTASRLLWIEVPMN